LKSCFKSLGTWEFTHTKLVVENPKGGSIGKTQAIKQQQRR